jgi:hypothetical protein
MEVFMTHKLQLLWTAVFFIAICGTIFSTALFAATITSTGTGGNWSAAGTWVGGVPTASDDVIIADGATVTIDGAVTVASITVGQGTSGILTFDGTTGRVVNVSGNITVSVGGTFNVYNNTLTPTGDVTLGSFTVSNVSSTTGVVSGMNISGIGIPGGTLVTTVGATDIGMNFAGTATGTGILLTIKPTLTDSLVIGGDLTNNGIFDMSLGGSTTVCNVTFTKVGDQTISGTGTITRFRHIWLAKTAKANKVIASTNVSTGGMNINFVAGTWEQNAGRLTTTSGSISIGSVTVTSAALNIVGSGGVQITSTLNVYGSLLVNTTDSLIVGTGTNKIDLTYAGGAVATFTKGTVVVYGKFNMASISAVTFNGANLIIDPKSFTATDYAFRVTTGGGTNPFTFTDGTITILNPSGSSNPELAMSSSIAPIMSGNSTFVLGQGAKTVKNTAGAYRINLSTISLLNNLTINMGDSVGITLLSNVKCNGKLTVTSCGTQTGAFTWKADNYLFNGTAAQTTGIFMPDTVRKVVIDNAAGVTISKASLTILDTLQLISGTLSGTLAGPYVTVIGGTAVEKNILELPREYSLQQNYPNPFNPNTNFTYQIAKTGFVSVKIYNVLGQEVVTLVNEVKQSGTYPATWNAAGFGSGIYFCKMQAGSFTETKKMLLVK